MQKIQLASLCGVWDANYWFQLIPNGFYDFEYFFPKNLSEFVNFEQFLSYSFLFLAETQLR